MNEYIEMIIGSLGLGLAAFSHFAQEIFPVITFVAAITGAILGCHGVYIIVSNSIRHRKDKFYETHFHHHGE